MSKLIMLSGLPASGKSTRAQEIVSNGNWIRVNRDLLRKMLHCGKWSGINEGITVDVEKSIAFLLLKDNKNIVVDDTNLNPKNKEMWKEVAKLSGATFEHEHIDAIIEDCIQRDGDREESVGEHVIVQMAMQYGMYPKPAKPFVLCDLDGTLCDIEHRLHFVKDVEKKDWKNFFMNIPMDKIRVDTLELLNKYSQEGHEIIFVSARPDTYRYDTERWLDLHCPVAYSTVIMRRGGDSRPDTDVKKQIFDTYFKDKYPIETVIDDRPSVIRMWREQGLNVIDVGKGVEF